MFNVLTVFTVVNDARSQDPNASLVFFFIYWSGQILLALKLCVSGEITPEMATKKMKTNLNKIL